MESTGGISGVKGDSPAQEWPMAKRISNRRFVLILYLLGVFVFPFGILNLLEEQSELVSDTWRFLHTLWFIWLCLWFLGALLYGVRGLLNSLYAITIDANGIDWHTTHERVLIPWSNIEAVEQIRWPTRPVGIRIINPSLLEIEEISPSIRYRAWWEIRFLRIATFVSAVLFFSPARMRCAKRCDLRSRMALKKELAGYDLILQWDLNLQFSHKQFALLAQAFLDQSRSQEAAEGAQLA